MNRRTFLTLPMLVPAARRDKPVIRIVAIGDSNTQRGTEDQTDWPRQVTNLSEGRFHVTNRGIHRNSAAMISARFLDDCLTAAPHAVIVTTGSVDLQEYGVADEEILKHVRWMKAKADAAGVGFFVGACPPMERPLPYGPSHAGAVIRYNNALGYWARDARVPVLNFHGPLATWDGAYRDGLADDFVHPSKEGRAIMTQVALTRLTQVYG